MMRVPFVDLKSQYRGIAPEINYAIHGVVERADFILGQDVERFEAEFAAYIDVKYSVGVGSGLAAFSWLCGLTESVAATKSLRRQIPSLQRCLRSWRRAHALSWSTSIRLPII